MGKLQDQMKTDLLLKRYSPHTTRAYLRCIRDFAKYFMRSPAEMGETEVRQFLLHLTQERKVSSGLQTTYVSALKFLTGPPCGSRELSNTSLTQKDPKPSP
jgi:integrase/recombinase XerD